MSDATATGATSSDGGPGAGRPAEPRTRVALPDLVVAAVLIGTGVFWFAVTDDTWFFADEWLLASRGRSVGDLFQPYNGHLSVTYIALYRVFFAVFGFTHYEVLRVALIVTVLSVPALLHLTTRDRWGPAPAGVVAVAIAWIGDVSLEAGGINHPATIAAGVVVAWALDREGRRADLVVALGLTVALCTSGGGVATAVACVVHHLVRGRPDRARALAILAPVGAWVLWWAAIGRDAEALDSDARSSLVDVALLAVEGPFATLRSLALGSTIGAWVLTVGVVALAVSRVRRDGPRGSARLVAWSAASVAWWVGLGLSRGELADPEVFRYRFVGAVYIALALVPPIGRPTAPRPPRRDGPLGAAAVAAVAIVLVLTGHEAVAHWGDAHRGYSDGIQRQVAIARAQPPVIGPDTTYNLFLGGLTRADLDALARTPGSLPAVPRDEVDRVLVGRHAVTVRPRRPHAARDCAPAPAPVTVESSRLGSGITVRTGADGLTLSVRRFGEELVPVAQVPPRTVVQVTFAVDSSPAPWVVSVPGACVVPAPG